MRMSSNCNRKVLTKVQQVVLCLKHMEVTAAYAKANLPELLKAAGAQEIHNMITNYALRKGRTPGQLSTGDKRELIQILNEQGFLRLRNTIATTASALHVTRPTIYKYLKTEA